VSVQHLSQEELLRLLGEAKAKRARDWLIMLVAFWHGLRISEVLAITPAWVKDGHITVQRLKGSLKTVQPLVSSEEPLLDEATALPAYLAEIPAGTRAFPLTRQYFWRLFEAYAAAAGIPAHKRHPHVLKHSIAMQSIKTAGIENVRQHLGHRSISSTGEYLKVSDDQASAAVHKGVLGATGEAVGGSMSSEVQREISRQLAALVEALKKQNA
jgi:integrase/recombinase XerD